MVTQSGQVLFTRDDIERGREVWRDVDGRQRGPAWGQRALAAPDWSAAYAIRNGAVPDAANRHALAAFCFWTSWTR